MQQERTKSDNTKFDDMLMKMITPKVAEIEKKFSDGNGINQEDINTLLLQSQYNHINHLDEKLSQVADSVISLENKFDEKFQTLEINVDGKLQAMDAKFNAKFEEFDAKFNAKFEKFDAKLEAMGTEFDAKLEAMDVKFTAKIEAMGDKFDTKIEAMGEKFEDRFHSMEEGFHTLGLGFASLSTEFTVLNKDIQITIQKSLNRNILMIFAMMGLFLTLSKLMDRFL